MDIYFTLTSDTEAGAQLLQMFDGLRLTALVPALVLLAVGLLVVRVILKIVDRSLRRSKLERAATGLIRSLLKVTLYLLLGLMVASRLGVDVTGVVALASVASLALSLALQDALANVIGGFTLLSNHPFKAGDFVEIAGQAGTVQTIDITYTRLATPDNKIISIPNSAVVAAQIINYSASGTRRVDINVRVGFDTPAAEVKDALLRAAQIPTVFAEPAPLAGILRYGENSTEYVLQVWTNATDYWKTHFTIHENIRTEFTAAGIDFAVPRMDVRMER